MNQNNRSPLFRADIEGLRGIAVLIVVAYHCRIAGFSGGFVGVDVFFVLSGYLITGLLVAEFQKTARLDLLQFYARRVRRLLPAAALTLVVTMLIGALVLAPLELSFAGRAAMATALYVSNVFFAVSAADYFAPGVESNPMLHTWSLGVEEQFYLIWPLLILLGLGRLRSRKALVVLLSGLTLVSFVACVWSTYAGGTFAFYQLPARAWEFAVGGLAVLIPRGALKIPTGGWLALGWLGVLAILGSGSYIEEGAGFPGWVALAPAVGTILALISGAELPGRGVGVVLASGPLQLLGTLSYSWYLWHWPFLVFAAALYPEISTTGKIAAAVASLVIAGAAHHLVENPIRFHPYLMRRPALCISLAAAVTLFSLGASVSATLFAGRLSNVPGMKAITAAARDFGSFPRQECASLGQTSDVKTCVFGDQLSATNVVLFGDSHAIQWFNPLRRMAEAHGWKLTTLVKPGCTATDTRAPGRDYCEGWRTEAIRRITSMRPALVFVGSAGPQLAGGENTQGEQSGISLEDWRSGTRRTLGALATAGLQVATIRDNPRAGFDISACLARSIRHSWYPGGSCEMRRSVVLNEAVFEAEKASVSDLRNVHFFDLTDQLCNKDVCWAVRGGVILYRDNNHLTGAFTESLLPVLERELLPLLSAPR